MYAPTPKCRDTDYIDFLIASPEAFCCTEAAAVQPESVDPPAHDAFTRLLHRLEPDPATLWEEARPLVHRGGGLLVLDDSTLNKPYARKIELVRRHRSGEHKRVVWGINLMTMVWTDGDRVIPRDYRLYDKAGDGLTEKTTSWRCSRRPRTAASSRVASRRPDSSATGPAGPRPNCSGGVGSPSRRRWSQPPPAVVIHDRVLVRRKGCLFRGWRRVLARIPAVIVDRTPIAADPVVQTPVVVEEPTTESPAEAQPPIESGVAPKAS